MKSAVFRAFLSSPLILVSVSIAHGWEGFDWEVWREEIRIRPPTIASPQAGLSDLLPLMVKEGPGSGRIGSIAEWETKRDSILDVLQTMLGAPSDLPRIPPYTEILGEEDLGTYVRRRLRIAAEPDDWIPAYLLIPKDLPDKPMPATIVLHQTQAPGKNEPCGIEGNPEMAFAKELVERGYICIAPDVIGFGERIPPGEKPYHGAHDFYRKHPDWSFFGKMVFDFQQVVNYLETLPIVDPYRIGSIGHSHGAYGTILCSIFEPRIAAAIASCGFNTLRTDPSPNRWSHLTALLPRLGFYVDDIKAAPFDWHEIIACLAPRPFFNWATLADDIFPNTENLADIYGQVKEVYGLYGAGRRFEGNLVPGKHSFSKAGRKKAYEWLDRELQPRPDPAEYKAHPPASIQEWESVRPQIVATLLRDIGPVDPPALASSVFQMGSEEKEGYTEKRIRYRVTEEETISAYLLEPVSSHGPCPGIVVFHQTAEEGKEEPVGHSGQESLHFGPELARRGYVVLAPDSIAAGERITESGPFDTEDFYRKNPSYSAMGKMIQDGRRAIDILSSQSKVDRNRIGTLGHSLGAEESLFVAAFDDRVKAAAASCGYAPFKVETNPSRWARDHWFSYMPRLRADLRADRLPAWDFDDVIRLVAPRGYFNYQTTKDEIFPQAGAAHPMTLSTREIWRLYGAVDKLKSRLDPGPHDIAPEGKAEVYGWLDSLLKPTN
jgi:dienelactone hydrolase